MSAPTILYDHREKQPWDAAFFGKDFNVKETHLVTGDYTLHGMDQIVAIERKGCWDELASNIYSKKSRENFIKELRRMDAFPVRLLLIEDDLIALDGFCSPFTQGVTSQSLQDWILTITLEYGVHVLPVGKRGRNTYYVRSLFHKLATYQKEGRLYYHG